MVVIVVDSSREWKKFCRSREIRLTWEIRLERAGERAHNWRRRRAIPKISKRRLGQKAEQKSADGEVDLLSYGLSEKATTASCQDKTKFG